MHEQSPRTPQISALEFNSDRPNPASLFSVRMRAAQGGPHEKGGRHISGAERIVSVELLKPALELLLYRAQNHTRGIPDFINFSIEQFNPAIIKYASTLPVTTLKVKDYFEGRNVVRLILERLGLKSTICTQAISLIANKSPADQGVFGAWLLEARTGQLLGPAQGVRISRMDLADTTRALLVRELAPYGLDNHHVLEALVLASKAMLPHASVAEVCWSDDPDYTAGYIASRRFGYLRIPYLKPAGLDGGGRVLMIKKPDLESYIHFLTQQPVLFTKMAPIYPSVDGEIWLNNQEK